MNGISILFILLMSLLGFSFCIGTIILLFGLLKKDKRNSTIKTGLILTGIPVGLVFTFYFYEIVYDIFTVRPTDKDLVGIYHITDAGNLIPSDKYKAYTLEFKDNGSFYLTSTPNIEMCETGNYFLDWQSKSNELSFECGLQMTTAHIDRRFSDFRIEFIIGDPDSGESIYFMKGKK